MDEPQPEQLAEALKQLLSPLKLTHGSVDSASPPPSRMEVGEGGDPWNSICGSILFYGEDQTNGIWGPPFPLR